MLDAVTSRDVWAGVRDREKHIIYLSYLKTV